MDQLKIRRAREDDVPVISYFNRCTSIETENHQLPEDVSLSGVQRLIEQSEFGFCVVAELKGKVVGALLITYEWSDWRNGLIWWMASVYILPEHRRKGIFRKLYTYVKETAEKIDDVRGIRLYVHDENTEAKATYGEVGMKKTAYRIFEAIL